jgi:S-adenosylmethionine hydrolase
VVQIAYQPAVAEGGRIRGNIPILDIQYGNVWTNIPEKMMEQLGIHYGDKVAVEIYQKDQLKYSGETPFAKTFESVPEGQPLCYINSLLNFSLALNMSNFAHEKGIGSGADWTIILRKK